MLTSDQAAQLAAMYSDSQDMVIVQHEALAHVQFQSYVGILLFTVVLIYCLVSLALTRPRKAL